MARRTSWWIGVAEHTISDDVPAPPKDVRAFYVDLTNIKAVHPLVVAVETIAREDTGNGYVQTYRVRDRVPVGPIRLAIVYTARVDVPATGDVHTEAVQFPRVRLAGTVSFDGHGASTRITERLRIEAPRPLLSVTSQQAHAAHVAMLAGIRRCFEL